jgi:hypothetical protein
MRIIKVIDVVFLVATLFAIFSHSVAFSHPDGAKPYFYPSTFIYGFVSGCAETVEHTRAPITQELWPDAIRGVCSCVVDALRHSMTFDDAQNDLMKPKMQVIVDATFPICVDQIKAELANATN